MEGIRFSRNRRNTRSFGTFLEGNPSRLLSPVAPGRHGNLVPRVSPLHAPGSERGETLVGAGHVSPREKLDLGRGPSPASRCQDLLSTPKKGFRYAARSPRETRSSGYVFQ